MSIALAQGQDQAMDIIQNTPPYNLVLAIRLTRTAKDTPVVPIILAGIAVTYLPTTDTYSIAR